MLPTDINLRLRNMNIPAERWKQNDRYEVCKKQHSDSRKRKNWKRDREKWVYGWLEELAN
jgi:hypothetical protein